ncbi:unnamed protein product, partial [Nesidiocoris tenuis]
KPINGNVRPKSIFRFGLMDIKPSTAPTVRLITISFEHRYINFSRRSEEEKKSTKTLGFPGC